MSVLDELLDFSNELDDRAQGVEGNNADKFLMGMAAGLRWAVKEIDQSRLEAIKEDQSSEKFTKHERGKIFKLQNLLNDAYGVIEEEYVEQGEGFEALQLLKTASKLIKEITQEDC